MSFTYTTIIGRDLNLLRGHVKNVKEYAGYNLLECDKEILVIIYFNDSIPHGITADIKQFCEDEGLVYYLYKEPEKAPFIENLYACWNLGYAKARGDLVFRGGSDQVFSRDSFPALINLAHKYGEGIILQANTIENKKRLEEMKTASRHFALNLGSTFEDFDYEKFEENVRMLTQTLPDETQIPEVMDIDTALRIFGKPTAFMSSLGMINRVDGCSWLMRKSDWEKFGPMPPLENGITGDVIIHDRMQKAGYKSLLVRDCITYHFVRGESLNVQ